MKKSIRCLMVLILFWFSGMVGCQEKTENLSIPNPVLSTSDMMIPLRSNTRTEISVTHETVVFVCESSGAKRYHFKSTCRGLKRCSNKIQQLSIINAENIGLTICGYEN